jgi:hypothetical protein
MNTKEKYTEIIKEVMRNEAVSKDKLTALAEKHGANKLKIQGYLRKAGVIEGMGNGVNRVLIRGQEVEPYADKVLELTKGGYEKKKGKEGTWTKAFKDEMKNVDDPNTHARAEAAIDLNAKLLEMMNAHMDKVQINTNKQNEYIAQLERRIENLTGFADIIGVTNVSIEVLENKVQALQDIYAGHKTEIKNNTNDGVIEDLTKRIEFLEQYDYSKEIDDINTEIVHHGDWLSGHDTELATFRSQLKDQADKLAAMQVRLDAQLTHICEHRGNGNVLRALHQLLGELI